MKSNNCCRHIDDDNEPEQEIGRDRRVKKEAVRRRKRRAESRRQLERGEAKEACLACLTREEKEGDS